MSVTSGFFNSIDGDRRYSAEQMSAIFDGVITDGVFAGIGTEFEVNAVSGNEIAIGVGRAWFNSTWIYNDAVLLLTAEASDVLQNRYDAVVIEVDHSEASRSCDIKIVKGTPSSEAEPAKPIMVDTEDIHQHPLAYIYRKAGSNVITQSNITYLVKTACPYVTSILQVSDISKNVAQWETEFVEWFDSVKDILGEDAAIALANRISNIESGATVVGKATADAKGNDISATYATKKELEEASSSSTTIPSHTHTKSQITDFPSTMKPSSHTHTKSEITDFPTSIPASAHDQAASTITAGEFAGKVRANATSVATVGDSQVRNIHAGISGMTSGTTSLVTGGIYIQYE